MTHSATTTKSDRQPLDRYDSPEWMPDVLFYELPGFPSDTTFLECCKGGGSISKTILEHGYEVITADIDPSAEPDFVLDMTKPDSWDALPHFDYVITNPPFCDADAIVGMAIPRAKGVMMLLRKTWDEPTVIRYELLEKHPWTNKICLPRYKFARSKDPSTGLRTGNWQTDSTPIDWFMWMPSMGIPTMSVYSEDKINKFSRYTANPDREGDLQAALRYRT